MDLLLAHRVPGRRSITLGASSQTSSDYEGTAYGAIVYGRGPLFVEALAETMGEDAFLGFLRAYYEANKGGIGTGSAFRELAETHCSCDLGELFDQWVYQ